MEGRADVRPHAPSTIVRQRILRWTIPWHVLCLSAIFAWGHYPLSLSWQGRPECQAYLLSALVASIALVFVGKCVGTLFDRPGALATATCLLLAGTAVIGLPLLSAAPPWPVTLAGIVACGIGTALAFVLWCEYLSLFPTVRVVFTLCVNLVMAGALIWFEGRLDGTGLYVALLCCVALSYAGVRRGWEVSRGQVEVDGGEPRLVWRGHDERLSSRGASARLTPMPSEGRPNAAEAADAGNAGTSSTGARGDIPLRTLVALFVSIVCLVAVKSLANGSVMEQPSAGAAVAPLVVLCVVAFCEHVPLGWLFYGTIVTAVAGVLAVGMPFDGAPAVCVALCDVAYAGTFVLLAAVGSRMARGSGADVCSVAAIASASFTAASLLGGIASEGLRALFPYGSGFPVLAISCVAIVVCGVASVSNPSLLQTDVSLAAPDAESASTDADGAGHAAWDATGAGDGTRNAASSTHANAPADLEPRDPQAFCASHGLQGRRAEVLALLLQGKSAGQIAQDLVVAQGTVKAHIHGIYQALGVHSRDELFELVAREAPERDASRQEAPDRG